MDVLSFIYLVTLWWAWLEFIIFFIIDSKVISYFEMHYVESILILLKTFTYHSIKWIYCNLFSPLLVDVVSNLLFL